MSQYKLNTHAGYPGFKCVVGWNGPLNTFFCQLLGPGEETILWLGRELGEYPDPEPVLEAISGFAQVPPELKQVLLHDKAQQPLWQTQRQ